MLSSVAIVGSILYVISSSVLSILHSHRFKSKVDYMQFFQAPQILVHD